MKAVYSGAEWESPKTSRSGIWSIRFFPQPNLLRVLVEFLGKSELFFNVPSAGNCLISEWRGHFSFFLFGFFMVDEWIGRFENLGVRICNAITYPV